MSTVKSNTLQVGQSVTATNNFCLYQPSTPDGTVRLGNGNSGSVTDLVTLTSAGNFGIGTSSPTAFGAGYATLTVTGSTAGVIQSKTTGNDARFYANATETLLGNWAATPIRFITNSAETMRLDSSGNLGLGVTPSGWATLKAFSVGSTGSSIAGNANGVYLTQSAYYNSGWKYSQSSNPAALYQQVDNAHSWHIAPSGTAGNPITFTQAMTLDASGRLIVGATSLSQQGTITGYSNTGSPAARMVGGSGMSDGSIAMMVDKYSTTSTTSQWFLGFTINNQATASGVITANGASQAAFGTWSDRRLKTNIVDLPSQLSNILALRPVEFDYIESEGGGHQISFIAQEMEEVYPDAVGERPDGMKTITGWSKTEARLVKAIQELSAELNELKAKVNA